MHSQRQDGALSIRGTYGKNDEDIFGPAHYQIRPIDKLAMAIAEGCRWRRLRLFEQAAA
ncbi:hypothetical protein [Alloprevotella tannerae]